MSIFQISKNRYAIGSRHFIAKYVVDVKGNSITGVRGVRPRLDDRFKVAKVSKNVAAVLREYA